MQEHAYLLLAVNKIADAGKHVYNDMFVQPDVFVKSDDNYEDFSADPTVSSAISWLNSKGLLSGFSERLISIININCCRITR